MRAPRVAPRSLRPPTPDIKRPTFPLDSRQNLAPGIVLTLLAGVLFAGMDALGKHLTGLVPVLQVVWGRYFFQTLFVSGYLAATSGTSFLKPRRPVLQVLRGFAILAATICMYEALAFVPLADATAVLFFAPILVTLFSVAFLGERIGIHRIAAVLAGFGGMLLILRPGFSDIHPALVLVLVAAVFNATYLLLTRRLAGTEDAAATQFNTTAVGAAVMTLVVLPTWETPSPLGFALLAAAGGAGSLGHFILVKAFASAPASLLSPFLYSQVIAAGLLSVLLFGDALRATTLVGTAILVLSGLYIWKRENRRILASPAAVVGPRVETPRETTR